MRIVFRNPVRSFGHRARPNSIHGVTPLDRPEFISPLAAGQDSGVAAAATHYPVSPEEAAVLQARIAALEDKLAKKPSARIRIQPAIDEAQELLAGKAQWEIALRWLRNRAKGLKGDLDFDALRYALYFLGWQLTLETEKVVKIYDRDSSKNELPAAVAGNYAYVVDLPEDVQIYPGKKADRTKLPPGNYVTQWTRIGRFVKRADGSVQPEFEGDEYAYYTDLPYTRAHNWPDYLGDPIVKFGDAFTVVHDVKATATVTNREGKSATFSGSGAPAWKALYGLGLEEAAAALLPSLDRAAEEARRERESWGRSLCAVCFGYAAVTPRKGTMVDHGHQRPGVGFNVSPCLGNRYAPYSVSDEGTRKVLSGEKHFFGSMADKAEAMIADPKGQVFDAVRPVYENRDGYPQTVRERDPERIRLFGDRKVEEIKVRYGDPDYDRIYNDTLRKTIMRMQQAAGNIAFYAAAVRIWTPNNTIKVEDIHNTVRETDKPHHPLLLARVNPRRAQRNPRRPRSRR